MDSLVQFHKGKNFKVDIDYNGEYFDNIFVSKDLPLENLSESNFLECLLELSLAWSFVMDNFDFRNIQRKKMLMQIKTIYGSHPIISNIISTYFTNKSNVETNQLFSDGSFNKVSKYT